VYFSLESEDRPLLSQMLGAAIVQDLVSATAALQREPVPSLVVIDEFSAVAAEQVVRLFARARSTGMSVMLGTQELADLRLPGREGLLDRADRECRRNGGRLEAVESERWQGHLQARSRVFDPPQRDQVSAARARCRDWARRRL
jgi:hypothetical protein